MEHNKCITRANTCTKKIEKSSSKGLNSDHDYVGGSTIVGFPLGHRTMIKA